MTTKRARIRQGALLPLNVRKWLYRVLLAAFPVACFYWPQLIPAAPLWLALGVAALNVPKQETV